MNCYDCALDDRTTIAVAVCARCGAGLCRDHLNEGHVAVHEVSGLGPSEHGKLARHLTCDVCHAAEHTP